MGCSVEDLGWCYKLEIENVSRISFYGGKVEEQKSTGLRKLPSHLHVDERFFLN